MGRWRDSTSGILLQITLECFVVKSSNFMIFPDIKLEIFRYMFRNDAINTVAMGITFSKVAFCIFKFFFFNWMLMYSAMTILEVYTNKKKTVQSLFLKICREHAEHCSKQCTVGNLSFFPFFSFLLFCTVLSVNKMLEYLLLFAKFQSLSEGKHSYSGFCCCHSNHF